jgi:hypothetical protein
MRTFSTRERELINKIIKGDTFYFREFFPDFFLENVKIDVPLKADVEIKTVQHSERIQYQQVAAQLVISIKLVELLEAQGWIYRFKVDAPFGHSSYIGTFENVNEKQKNSLVTDQFIKKELAKNIQMEFVITEELKVFVSNNFKTKEDVQTRRSFNISRGGLVVATLGACTAIFSISYSFYHNQKIHGEMNNRISALNNEVENLSNQNEQLLKGLEEMTFYKKTIDSLRVAIKTQKKPFKAKNK